MSISLSTSRKRLSISNDKTSVASFLFLYCAFNALISLFVTIVIDSSTLSVIFSLSPANARTFRISSTCLFVRCFVWSIISICLISLPRQDIGFLNGICLSVLQQLYSVWYAVLLMLTAYNLIVHQLISN